MGEITLAKYSDIQSINTHIGDIGELNVPDDLNLVNAINSINILSEGVEIPEGSDLNSYIEPGVYYFSRLNDYNTLSNIPSPNYLGSPVGFKLVVERLTDQQQNGGIKQHIIVDAAIAQHTRYYHYQQSTGNMIWGSWAAFLPWQGQAPRIFVRSDSINSTVSDNNVTGTRYMGMVLRDVNNYDLSLIGNAITTDGKVTTGMWNYNRDTDGTLRSSHGFKLITDKDGNYKYTVDQSDALLKALGLYKTTASTATSVVTAASSITVQGSTIHKYGPFYSWTFTFKHSNAWTSNSSYSIGTLASAYRPVQYVVPGNSYLTSAHIDARVAQTGAIHCTPHASRAANSQEYITFAMYLANNANT